MKKKKKLSLSRTTVAAVAGRDLARVAGGNTTDEVKPGGMNSRCIGDSKQVDECGGLTDPDWTCGCPGPNNTTPTFNG